MLTQRTRNSSTAWSKTAAMAKRSMVDWVDDEWKIRRSQGVLTCNSMTADLYKRDAVAPLSGIVHRWYRASSLSPWIDKGLFTIPIPLHNPQFSTSAAWNGSNPFGAAQNLMTSKGLSFDNPSIDEAAVFHTKLSDELSSGIALIGVSLSERLKTLRMFKEAVKLLKNPFINARNALGISRSALRGNPNAALTVMNEANKRWLEGRYGWRPLAYEVMAMWDAAANGDNQRISVRSWDGYNPTTAEAGLTNTYSSKCAFGIKAEYVCSGKNRYGQTGDFNLAVSNWGRDYGLYDVVGTAWELVPYSFVVDWYINVGEALGALQAFALLDERVGWTSRTSELSARCFPYVINPGNPSASSGTKEAFVKFTPDNWEAWERLTYKVRIPVESFMPVLDLRLNLNVTKIIDQVALLREATLKGRRH